ncbi:MAG: helix-turn-helix transcriptional regulator [Verrucomicrobia bacterium]|nr:helix-turn-helix transcriptional regulator [Verrucomicrobiota bacterium]
MIGRRIALLRARRGFTQTELAKKLGMSQPLLSRYERGELRLHGALVAELATALAVPSDEILGLTETKDNGAVKDRRLLRLAQEIDRLPRQDKRALIRTIEQYLKGAHVP